MAVCCMQQEVPWIPVSCVPVSFIGVRFGLGNGLTRVHFSLVTAKKPQKQQKINSTSNNTTCLKEK
jgi:hypothetical protein